MSEQHLVEDLGLRHVAREPVEQEALRGVVLGQPVADHPDGDLVGHQVAGVHVLARLERPAGCPG